MLLALASGCGGRGEQPSADSELQVARVALAASFVGGHGRGLRELLHPELIVQPPEPDTAHARRGGGGIPRGLARESQVARSELLPVSPEPRGRLSSGARGVAPAVRGPHPGKSLHPPLAENARRVEGRSLALDLFR